MFFPSSPLPPFSLSFLLSLSLFSSELGKHQSHLWQHRNWKPQVSSHPGSSLSSKPTKLNEKQPVEMKRGTLQDAGSRTLWLQSHSCRDLKLVFLIYFTHISQILADCKRNFLADSVTEFQRRAKQGGEKMSLSHWLI